MSDVRRAWNGEEIRNLYSNNLYMTDLAILFRFCSKLLSAESKQVIQGYLGGSNRLITYLDYAHPPTDVLESKPEAAPFQLI